MKYFLPDGMTREDILAEHVYDPERGTLTSVDGSRKTMTMRSGGAGYWYDKVGDNILPRALLVWFLETGRRPMGQIRFYKGREKTIITNLYDNGSPDDDVMRDFYREQQRIADLLS